MRVGMAALVMVACVGLAACSGSTGEPGGTESETTTSGSGESTTNSSSATSDAEPAEGKRVSVSVASVVLPEGLDLTEKVVSDDAKVEYHKWYTTYPGTDEPSCVISLSVESDVGDSAAIVQLEEARTMRTKNLQTATMDPDAPQDVVGTLLEYAGTWETESGSQKASSIARTWQTPGNTLIGLAVNANDDGPSQCDPTAIAATLQWSGQERATGGADS